MSKLPSMTPVKPKPLRRSPVKRGTTWEIPLTQGLTAIVDDIDADLARMNWFAHYADVATVYARRHDGFLHTVVAFRMGIQGSPDHINRNGLDCRRDNLRPGTRNIANQRLRSSNTSGFRGVCPEKGRISKPWKAQILVSGKRRYIGGFRTAEDAALAYDTAALEEFGEYAVLNFPRACEGQR